MADVEIENTLGLIDKRRTQTQTGVPGDLGESPYQDVGSLRFQLTSRNASYYTSNRLNNMTKNDMVYALRTIDDAAGI